MSASVVDGTILDVQFIHDKLQIRLDTNVLWQEQEKYDPILTVRLSGCPDVAELLKRLRLHIGKYLYLQVLEEAGAVVGVFLDIDDGADEMQIVCDDVIQEPSEYTQVELRRRCKWLFAKYTQSENARIAAERKHTRFTTELAKIANSELDRSRRKMDFFRQTNPERASEMEGRIAAYERVLTKIAQSRKPDEGAV